MFNDDEIISLFFSAFGVEKKDENINDRIKDNQFGQNHSPRGEKKSPKKPKG